MKNARIALVALALLILSSSNACVCAAPLTSQDVWLGVYFGQTKVGHSHFSSAPDTRNGRSVQRIDSETVTALTVFGASVQQKVVSHTWAASANGEPIYETFAMSSGGTDTTVTASFHPDHIDATLTSGGSTSTRNVLIPSGVKLTADDLSNGLSTEKALKVGQVLSEVSFNPVTLALETDTAKVVSGNTPVTDASTGGIVHTTCLEVSGPEGDLTVYQTQDGIPVRIEMPAGLVMQRETKQDALADNDPEQKFVSVAKANPQTLHTTTQASSSGQYVPPPDFAVLTSVDPAGVAIDDPRSCQWLKAKLFLSGEAPRVVAIHAVSVPPLVSGSIKDDGLFALRAFVSDAPYLAVSSAVIRSRAKEIAGTETSLYEIARRIHDWVHNTMVPNGTMGLPRSAADVYNNPQGVCRDYAVLYTALARAAGVPTRVCAGIVSYKGRFYYHAWAESYIGETAGWMPVDATEDGMFVDATHIPLAKGDPTTMYGLTRVVGTMKVQVIQAGS